MKRYTVFLDRDGTINEDTGYIGDPEGVIVFHNAPQAINMLNTNSIKVIVITNQSGVGRGYFSREALESVNQRVITELRKGGAHIDGVYSCMHHPDDKCSCRKPETGLIKKAVEEHNIDVKHSYVVGDKALDMELARRIGAKAILVLTGHGRDELKNIHPPPHFVAEDILDAVEWIIEDLRAS